MHGLKVDIQAAIDGGGTAADVTESVSTGGDSRQRRRNVAAGIDIPTLLTSPEINVALYACCVDSYLRCFMNRDNPRRNKLAAFGVNWVELVYSNLVPFGCYGG